MSMLSIKVNRSNDRPIAVLNKSSQNYVMSLVWDRTPDTSEPAVTPAKQAGTRFTYSRGMEG